jgi:hypothetical protein
MTDLDELERKARAATPGPWACNMVLTSCGRAFRLGAGEMLTKGNGACIIYDDYGCGDNAQKHNAIYIAAVSPSTILTLISEVREARKMKQENV